MPPPEAIAILDVGKTNKKIIVFNDQYGILFEISTRLEETIDEDNNPCEDLDALTRWIRAALAEIFSNKEFNIRAVNFSAYGASFVLTDGQGKPVAPLYNYLKPFSPELQKQFYKLYGGESEFSKITASPVLGNLNSGLQLYRLKQERPEVFKTIKHALHLPQYVSFLFTGSMYSDMTSIGCHTGMWNFPENRYHEWIYREGIDRLLPRIFPSDQAIHAQWNGNPVLAGVGLHDSSAAFIPYLSILKEPFVLLSTGTWSISLNPFNRSPLTGEELKKDCLCYLSYTGNPVKASRLFSGNYHDEQAARIAARFNLSKDFYTSFKPESGLINRFREIMYGKRKPDSMNPAYGTALPVRDLSSFQNAHAAYGQLIMDLVFWQYHSTQLVLKNSPAKTLFVDGGFSRNEAFMRLLAVAFPDLKVFASRMAQSTSLGAALAIHKSWNKNRISASLMEGIDYTASRNIAF